MKNEILIGGAILLIAGFVYLSMNGWSLPLSIPTPSSESGFVRVVQYSSNIIDASAASATTCDSPTVWQAVLLVKGIPDITRLDTQNSYVTYSGVGSFRIPLAYTAHPYEPNTYVFGTEQGTNQAQQSLCGVTYHLEFPEPSTEPPVDPPNNDPPLNNTPPGDDPPQGAGNSGALLAGLVILIIILLLIWRFVL